MKTDEVIKRRLAELAKQADDVAGTGRSISGSRYVDPEAFHKWAVSVLNLLQRVFTETSVHHQSFFEKYQKYRGWADEFENCRGIFEAAKEDYEGGYLFDVTALAKAETLVDVLDQAVIFKDAQYFDTACILAGIGLEIAVKEICVRKGIAPGKFNAMNEELRKQGVYNQAKWEQLKTWYTRRNEPAHGNFGQSTPQETDEMIKGVRTLIADYL